MSWKHGQPKLSIEQVKEMRALAKEKIVVTVPKFKQTDLAKIFNVSQATVTRVLNYGSHKNI